MTAGAVFWLAAFGICASLFFGIAVVVSIKGVGDLRDLLRSARVNKPPR